MYQVLQNVTGKSVTGETVDISYYRGDSLPKAMSALAGAAEQLEDDDRWYRVNSVRLVVE